MAGMGLLRTVWLTRLSQPAGERVLHRHVLRTPPRRVLEIGLGTLVRGERLLGALAARLPGGELQYVGIDRFEGREPGDPPGVSLKEAHKRLRALARVQLVPGNVDTALSRVCNQLPAFDLVLVAAGHDERHLARAWFFLPRLVHPATTVYVESAAGGPWNMLPRSKLDDLAARAVLRRAG